MMGDKTETKSEEEQSDDSYTDRFDDIEYEQARKEAEEE